LPRPHPVNAAELQLLQGPERIQSEWWLNSEARDYYIAQHSSGALCWVYCPCTIFNEPQSGEFYLHGYFA
jgi:protein ImuB